MRDKRFLFMKQDDQSKTDDEPAGLTIYNPEDQVFQKLHLCEYMRELYEAAEKENGHGAEKKKDFQRHLFKDCE